MLPRELAPRFALSQAELFYESNPWTREIFAMGEMVQGRLEAEVARAVVDLDRDPSQRPPEFLDGVVKTHTLYGKPIWTEDGFPTEEEIERLLDRYHRPYHEVLSRTANRGSVRIGIDCHSMSPLGPPHGADPGGVRPFFNIANFGNERGEAEDTTCPPDLMRALKEAIEQEFEGDARAPGVDLVRMNYPHQGGYILERHGRGYTPWLQLEINEGLYMSLSDDLNIVPDSDREVLASLRRRLLKVMASFSEATVRA
ncbi:MAG: N-formylglutamate amidohydrolase [Armatimonadetes bacterium]|nr:N-formylglutamate amidohydrolase [Armatimonadota bacterium]